MRKRGDVLDAGDFEAGVLELNDRLLATGAGALYLDFDLEHPRLLRDLAAFSAARPAAYGVLLRAPLKKPPFPADAQAMVSPLVSVMVTIVLLNVALMCAIPRVTPLRIFFFCAGFCAGLRLGLLHP